MTVSVIVVIYVFVLLAAGILSSLKRWFWGMPVPVLTSVLFLITRDEMFYYLAVGAAALWGICRATLYLGKAISRRRKRDRDEEMKIRDL